MINVPDKAIHEIKTIVQKFIWDGKNNKIKYNVMIQQIENGGLGLVDIDSKIKSLLLSWIPRYINNHGSWQAIPKIFQKKLGYNNWSEFFSSNLDCITLIDKHYPFFLELNKAWKT